MKQNYRVRYTPKQGRPIEGEVTAEEGETLTVFSVVREVTISGRVVQEYSLFNLPRKDCVRL